MTSAKTQNGWTTRNQSNKRRKKIPIANPNEKCIDLEKLGMDKMFGWIMETEYDDCRLQVFLFLLKRSPEGEIYLCTYYKSRTYPDF